MTLLVVHEWLTMLAPKIDTDLELHAAQSSNLEGMSRSEVGAAENDGDGVGRPQVR